MSRVLMTDKELHNKYPQLSLWTINELRRRGEIPYISIPGIRKYLFSLDEIEAWLDALGQVQPANVIKLRSIGR